MGVVRRDGGCTLVLRVRGLVRFVYPVEDTTQQVKCETKHFRKVLTQRFQRCPVLSNSFGNVYVLNRRNVYANGHK